MIYRLHDPRPILPLLYYREEIDSRRKDERSECAREDKGRPKTHKFNYIKYFYILIVMVERGGAAGGWGGRRQVEGVNEFTLSISHGALQEDPQASPHHSMA